jgi:hypothetical protein
MSDKSQDELRERFNRGQSDEQMDDSPNEEGVTDDTSGSSDTDVMDETGEKDQSSTQRESSGEGLKGRKQVAMYLPAELRSDLGDFYDELDARSTLAGQGGLQKNREFYEEMVEFVLDHRPEFADHLGIEISDE